MQACAKFTEFPLLSLSLSLTFSDHFQAYLTAHSLRVSAHRPLEY
jgi:hypothetical protein